MKGYGKMTNVVKIKLNTINEIKDFINIVNRYDEDVDIYRDNPQRYKDAKSFMSIISLDTSIGAYVRIMSSDRQIVQDFNNDMKQFKMEEVNE